MCPQQQFSKTRILESTITTRCNHAQQSSVFVSVTNRRHHPALYTHDHGPSFTVCSAAQYITCTRCCSHSLHIADTRAYAIASSVKSIAGGAVGVSAHTTDGEETCCSLRTISCVCYCCIPGGPVDHALVLPTAPSFHREVAEEMLYRNFERRTRAGIILSVILPAKESKRRDRNYVPTVMRYVTATPNLDKSGPLRALSPIYLP